MKVASSDIGSDISIQIVHGIEQVNAEDWNTLAAGRPFQSHTWHKFGEQVMADCDPIYLLAYHGEKLVGRASLWVIRNEPLPTYAGVWRAPLKLILKRWPLLICRSPLSYASGIIISADAVNRSAIFSLLIDAALEQGSQRKCSVLIFDYLGKADKQGWPREFSLMEAPQPGTIMENRWQNFDDYLANGNKKDRQHYKHTLRESEKLDIKIHRTSHAENIDVLMPLIRNMETKHGSPSNPWVGNMIRFMDMVGGIVLTVTAKDKLMGCLLLLEDNNAQIIVAPGRRDDMRYMYLMLLYEVLKVALEHKVRLLRWGSGAYDIKQKLGFELEDNGVFAFAPIPPLMQKIANWLT